jgi:hypothetical protein
MVLGGIDGMPPRIAALKAMVIIAGMNVFLIGSI